MALVNLLLNLAGLLLWVSWCASRLDPLARATPSTLVNLSCRARVGTGGDILIAGFVIRGTAPRRLLIRGVGPTLAGFGVAGTLADPKLEIIRQGETSPLATNDNWSSPVSPLTSSAATVPVRRV